MEIVGNGIEGEEIMGEGYKGGRGLWEKEIVGKGIEGEGDSGGRI